MRTGCVHVHCNVRLSRARATRRFLRRCVVQFASVLCLLATMPVYSIATIVVLAMGMTLISAQCPARHCCFDYVTTGDVRGFRCPVVLSSAQLCRVNPCPSNRYCRVSNGRVQCCREESRRLSTAFGSSGNSVSCRRTCFVPSGSAPSPPYPSCPSQVPQPTLQPCPRCSCSTLPAPCNGIVTTVNDNPCVCSLIATYSCNSGYRLQPNSPKRNCVNGRWLGDAPECISDCPTCRPSQVTPHPPQPVTPTLRPTRPPPPPPPRGSYPCPSNLDNGSYRLVSGVLVLYNCNSGFRLVGSNTAFCSGGTTTVKPPSCEGGPVVACRFNYVTSSGNKCPVELTQAQVCSRDPCRDDEYCQVSNGRTRCCKQEFRRLSTAFGQESSGCRQTCIIRSITSSSRRFPCPRPQPTPTPEQTEEPTSPTPCLVLPAPSNGVVTIVNDDECQSDATATYKCNSGYRLDPNNSVRECKNGHWLGKASKCLKDRPTTLQAPSNGAVTISEEGTTATYSCNFGFYLKPNKPVREYKNGEWSGSPPRCAPRKECHTFEQCKKVCVKGKALCDKNLCTGEGQYCRVKRGNYQCCETVVRETDNECVTRCRSAPP